VTQPNPSATSTAHGWHAGAGAGAHLAAWCSTRLVPTAHRRHAITETDDITNALELARKGWPELADKPGALFRQLILHGRNNLAHDYAAAADTRRQAVEATSGALAGVFGPSYLADLREDWPE
jgi:hypothetical protein